MLQTSPGGKARGVADQASLQAAQPVRCDNVAFKKAEWKVITIASCVDFQAILR